MLEDPRVDVQTLPRIGDQVWGAANNIGTVEAVEQCPKTKAVQLLVRCLQGEIVVPLTAVKGIKRHPHPFRNGHRVRLKNTPHIYTFTAAKHHYVGRQGASESMSRGRCSRPKTANQPTGNSANLRRRKYICAYIQRRRSHS